MIDKIIRFQQVASTQDTAKRFAQKGSELAVTALSQNRGRGRQGRSWFSPRGGLYVSLVLFPKKNSNSIPLLASLSVIRALEEFGFSKLTIHWPNDVLLNKHKVCGVVCDRYRDTIICGIGLNVNIKRFGKLVANATSMSIEAGKDFDVDKVFDRFLEEFNTLYEELQDKGLKIKEVLNYISGLGEAVEVITAKEVVKGTVYDIDDDWALLLRDEAGLIRKYYYGDVRRLQW
ncbi:MAG: biotin--[acetyl-CoA-carboxylase] ligase [candidate division WOR-3 bacterium]|jgi:BirA family biotin operon repressor/biotin-[acetyl-CoA-carboxylase] ligase